MDQLFCHSNLSCVGLSCDIKKCFCFKILKDEKYDTTEDRLMQYAKDSFERLLPKLQVEVETHQHFAFLGEEQ